MELHAWKPSAIRPCRSKQSVFISLLLGYAVQKLPSCANMQVFSPGHLSLILPRGNERGEVQVWEMRCIHDEFKFPLELLLCMCTCVSLCRPGVPQRKVIRKLAGVGAHQHSKHICIAPCRNFYDRLRGGERFFSPFSATICPSVFPNQIDYNNKTDKTLISMALQLAVALGQMEWVSTLVVQPLVNLNLC